MYSEYYTHTLLGIRTAGTVQLHSHTEKLTSTHKTVAQSFVSIILSKLWRLLCVKIPDDPGGGSETFKPAYLAPAIMPCHMLKSQKSHFYPDSDVWCEH